MSSVLVSVPNICGNYSGGDDGGGDDGGGGGGGKKLQI